jgi:hypothetical protein
VVEVPLNVGFGMFVALKPAAGAHAYEAAPLAVSTLVWPAQRGPVGD